MALQLSVAPHRPYFAAGERVKVHFALENLFLNHPAMSGGRTDSSGAARRTTSTLPASPAQAADGAVVRIHDVVMRLVGVCSADTTRFTGRLPTLAGDSAAAGGASAGSGSTPLSLESHGPSAAGGDREPLLNGSLVSPLYSSSNQYSSDSPTSTFYTSSGNGIGDGGTGSSSSNLLSSSVFFQSGVVEVDLRSNNPSSIVRLRSGEQLEGAALLTIPSHLPPSHRGLIMRFSYAVHVVCHWSISTGSGSDAVTVLQPLTLKLPLRVFSAEAVVRTLRAPYARGRPIPTDSIVVYPSQRGPAIAPPRASGLLTADLRLQGQSVTQEGTSGIDRNPLLAHPMHLRAVSNPSSTLIRVQQCPVVELLLLGATVQLGDSLRGVIRASPMVRPADRAESGDRLDEEVDAWKRVGRSTSGSATQEYSCVRVTLQTTTTEWIPTETLHRSIAPDQGPSRSGLDNDKGSARSPSPSISMSIGGTTNTSQFALTHTAVHSRIIDELDLFVGSALEVPFSLPVPANRYPQSFSSDVLVVKSYLRLTFYCCKESEWTTFHSSGKSKSLSFPIECCPVLEEEVVLFPPMVIQENDANELQD